MMGAVKMLLECMPPQARATVWFTLVTVTVATASFAGGTIIAQHTNVPVRVMAIEETMRRERLPARVEAIEHVLTEQRLGLTSVQDNHRALTCLVYVLSRDSDPAPCEAFMDDKMRAFVATLRR